MSQAIADQLKDWGHNFVHNTTSTYDRMVAKDYIRLIIIIGAYCLIRPQILRYGAYRQRMQHEADAREDTGADVHPNDLRDGSGKIAIPGVDSDSDDDAEEEPKAGDWGKKARVRQRKFIRTTLEKEEARLKDEQEDESDKDIEQYLMG